VPGRMIGVSLNFPVLRSYEFCEPPEQFDSFLAGIVLRCEVSKFRLWLLRNALQQ